MKDLKKRYDLENSKHDVGVEGDHIVKCLWQSFSLVPTSTLLLVMKMITCVCTENRLFFCTPIDTSKSAVFQPVRLISHAPGKYISIKMKWKGKIYDHHYYSIVTHIVTATVSKDYLKYET